MLDDHVVYFVVKGHVKPGWTADERARVKRAAWWLWWDGVRLYCTTHGVMQCIPAFAERQMLVHEAAQSLGYLGGRQLCRLLTHQYYWAGLARDVLCWCQEFVPV